MWIDERSEFADAVAVTLAAGSNLIGDVMDLGSSRDIGAGHTLYLILQVTTAFAGGTDFQFILASDSQAAIATDGAETRHYAGDVYTDAQLAVGFTRSIPLPSGDTALGQDNLGYERFLGIIGVGTGTHTAGAINAFLSPDSYGNVLYPDGNN